MRNFFSFLIIGLFFAVINVVLVEAQEETNPLESSAPAQSTGMSEIIDSSGGGANLAAGDLGNAAVDQNVLDAANAAAEKAERIAVVQKCIDDGVDNAIDSGARIFAVRKCDPTAEWKGQDENGRHIYIVGPGVK